MVNFDTGKYLVDLEFGLQVIGPIGNIIKTTQATISNGDVLELRRIDHDKDAIKVWQEQAPGAQADAAR